MAAPKGDGSFLTTEPIKILRRHGGQFLEHRRIKFPSRLRVGAGRGRKSRLAQRAEDFVERVLQGEFMATQDQHDDQREGQDAVASKSRRRRAKLRPRLCRRNPVTQTREKSEFVFLFILLSLPSQTQYFQCFIANLTPLRVRGGGK